MCMIEGSDGIVTVLSERKPTARKQHQCSECGRTIGVGERYMVERTVFDGRAETHKTCEHCQVCRRWLLHECSGFLYHGIYEDITEHLSYDWHGFGLLRLVTGIRNKWQRRDGRLWPVPKVTINGIVV